MRGHRIDGDHEIESPHYARVVEWIVAARDDPKLSVPTGATRVALQYVPLSARTSSNALACSNDNDRRSSQSPDCQINPTSYDLPKAWPATTRHREAEGSAYYRHFHMGLLDEDGNAKRALWLFPDYTPALGVCQWFHFKDHRLDRAVDWLRRLGVTYVRTGLSWSDTERPNYEAWFDRMMKALEPFDVTVTFCFTPESKGIKPHHTSAPREIAEYADFCARMVSRYAC